MPTVPPTEAAAKDIWSVFSDGYTRSPKESWDDLVDQKRRTLAPIRQQKWTGPCKHKQNAFIAGATLGVDAPHNVPWIQSSEPTSTTKKAAFDAFISQGLGRSDDGQQLLADMTPKKKEKVLKMLRKYFNQGLKTNMHLEWVQHCRNGIDNYERRRYLDSRQQCPNLNTWFEQHVKNYLTGSGTVRHDIQWLGYHARQVLRWVSSEERNAGLCVRLFHVYLACYQTWTAPENSHKLYDWIHTYANSDIIAGRAEALDTLDIRNDMRYLLDGGFDNTREARDLVISLHWPPLSTEVESLLNILRKEIQKAKTPRAGLTESAVSERGIKHEG
eukprot:g38859.t1